MFCVPTDIHDFIRDRCCVFYLQATEFGETFLSVYVMYAQNRHMFLSNWVRLFQFLVFLFELKSGYLYTIIMLMRCVSVENIHVILYDANCTKDRTRKSTNVYYVQVLCFSHKIIYFDMGQFAK